MQVETAQVGFCKREQSLELEERPMQLKLEYTGVPSTKVDFVCWNPNHTSIQFSVFLNELYSVTIYNYASNILNQYVTLMNNN